MSKVTYKSIPRRFFHLKITCKWAHVGLLVRFCTGTQDYRESVREARKLAGYQRARPRKADSDACVVCSPVLWQPDGRHTRDYPTAMLLIRWKRGFTTDTVAHEVFHALHVLVWKQLHRLTRKPLSELDENDRGSEHLAGMYGDLVKLVMAAGKKRYRREA